VDRLLLFTPVPGRARYDGWTAELQFRFIEALAAGLRPGEAAARVGRNRQNAYALRRRPGGEAFAAAWDKAVAAGRERRQAERRGATALLPQGDEAERIADFGLAEVDRLADTDPRGARAALDQMLDRLYGPRPAAALKSDNCDKGSQGKTFQGV
jgi:hypothetical protein